jgi:dimethylamine/trimethylamine dehydrogenase
MSDLNPGYLATLLRYYEEEIEGEAYFGALADRRTDPAESEGMHLLAEVETYAAAAVAPLLRKYDLYPASTEALHARGRAQAAAAPEAWAALIDSMRESFPGFIDDFERLALLAPAEDMPPLKVLTDHEHAAIAYLEREARGDPDSVQPLRHYLKTGKA